MGIEERELSNDEVLYWQNRLQERKNSYLKARDFLKKHTLKDLSLEEAGEISKVRLHPADLASQAQDIDTLDSLLEKNLKVTQATEEALDRLERGVFGICQSCGEAIARSRLEAIPETRYCLSCQSDLEEMRRASRGGPHSPIENLGSVLISDVMQENPVTILLDQALDAATKLMSENNIKHLPVVDKRGDVHGIISDRDLLGVVLDASWANTTEFEKFWSKKSVSSLMTKTPETITPDMSLRDAGAILLDNNISCLPVVEGNRLVGIITSTDFVKLICK